MHEWVDHTSEIELRVEASSAEAVLAEALEALGALLREREHSPATGGELVRELALTAPDLPALLAGWLAELAYLAESEGFMAERVQRLTLAGTELRAVVAGRSGTPPHLVKAVTYHRLEFREEAGRWRGRAVLDV